MLQLQAKHFNLDLKNKISKIQLENIKQKNMKKELEKKNEYSINDPLTKY